MCKKAVQSGWVDAMLVNRDLYNFCVTVGTIDAVIVEHRLYWMFCLKSVLFFGVDLAVLLSESTAFDICHRKRPNQTH